MDPSFFGLNGHPFRDSDSPGDPFVADAYESLTTELHAGLKAPHGITLLIGEEGAGKTTFIRAFAERQSDNCTVAYLPTTGPGLRHLLTEVVEQLGGSVAPGANEQVLLESLRGLAKARAEHDRSTLVIIDDAHELPSKTIERLGRLFGNDPAEPSKLHVTLVGRPELLDRMNAANDRSILKHLIQVCRMDAIGPEDAFRYIADRVQKVGGLVDRVFTEDALRLIVQKSNGIPAKIDAICTAAMDNAEGCGEASVGADTVDRACAGVDGLSVEETTLKDRNPETPSYFLGDEDPAEDEPLGVNPGEFSPASRTAPVFDHVSTENGGRRRLAIWALGFVGVVAAIAAVLTGGGENDAIDLAAIDNGAERSQIPPNDGLVIARNAAISGGLAETGPLPTEPLSVPKLVVNREAKTPPPAAAAPKGKDRAAAREKKGQSGGKREGQTVHASPAARVAGEEAPARPRVAAPKFEPKIPAQSPVTEPIQKAAQQAAAAQTQVAAAKLAPPTPAVPAAPKPALAKPVPVPVAKPAPTPAAKPAATAAVPASKPIPPTRPVNTAPATAPAVVAANTAPAGKTYTVQIGAFSGRSNAESTLGRLNSRYPDGRIVAVASNGKTVFRVVSGDFSDIQAANARAAALKQGGFTTYVRPTTQ